LADQNQWIDICYSVETSDRESERFGMIGELGDWPSFVGSVSYDALYEQYNVVATHQQFGTGIIITRVMMDDDLTGLMRGDMVESMARAAVVTRNKYAARWFNFMDSNDLTFFTHSEGVPLVSASHTTRTPGVSTATGYSNITTSAFSPTSYRAALIAFRRLKNDRGDLIDEEADEVWGGLDLGPRMHEVVDTPYGLDTPFRNVNPEYKSASVKTWNRITDANNWAICNAAARKRNLKWYNRVMPEFRQIADFETLQIKRAGYMRFSYARRHHYWILGGVVS
jgi:hypothetical protein